MSSNTSIRVIASIARYIFALAFIFFGASYFFTPAENMPALDPASAAGMFMNGLVATGYFLPVLKVIETLAGVMLLFKRWTPPALIVLAPIIFHIALYILVLTPAFAPMAIILIALELFLVWYNWAKFAPLFRA